MLFYWLVRNASLPEFAKQKSKKYHPLPGANRSRSRETQRETDANWTANARFSNGALPAHHARLIEFPFWECTASPTHAWVHPFASRLGATQSTRALALIGTYYTNIHLGYETLFGSPGAVPGTLSSRVGGAGINPLATRATGEHWFGS